ncbi:MAG: HyaD/HybD family hydrogenase maturation endopeptidase [Deltaproteobacteria bacterium]|jgi:hydrogenase maturation protease|nr:HyaD/HybD family hydrogenase maturation endopeptidase [Deltaproteobacteria bacterium]
MPDPRILLLGVGNILYADEGLGVHAAQYLERHYLFSSNVLLLEGGTLGKLLTAHIVDCDRLIVMDAVLGGQEAGSLYRLEDESLRKSLGFHDSQHQVDLEDVLAACAIIGNRPSAVVMGMEPLDWKSLSLELTPPCRAAIPRYIREILKELAATGGQAHPRGQDEGRQLPWLSPDPLLPD